MWGAREIGPTDGVAAAGAVQLSGREAAGDIREPNTPAMKRESGAHSRPREARLIEAASHLYPSVRPGVWIQAATMSDIVVSQQLQRGAPRVAGRVLDPAHFEFREGGASESGDTSLRRRATDRLRLRGD